MLADGEPQDVLGGLQSESELQDVVAQVRLLDQLELSPLLWVQRNWTGGKGPHMTLFAGDPMQRELIAK